MHLQSELPLWKGLLPLSDPANHGHKHSCLVSALFRQYASGHYPLQFDRMEQTSCLDTYLLIQYNRIPCLAPRVPASCNLDNGERERVSHNSE